MAQFACDTAIESDAIRGTSNDIYQALPSLKCAHDLAGATADWRRRIVWMQGKAHAPFFSFRYNSFQKVGDVVPHSIQAVRAFFRKGCKVFNFGIVKRGESCTTA